MSTQQDGISSMEGSHLREGMDLIRGDIREMRQELREGLERRPTHSDLGGLKALTEKQIEIITQRAEQDKLAHEMVIQNLRIEQARLEKQIDDIKKDAKTTQKEKDRLQKQVFSTFLLTIVGLAATNGWQVLFG